MTLLPYKRYSGAAKSALCSDSASTAEKMEGMNLCDRMARSIRPKVVFTFEDRFRCLQVSFRAQQKY